MASLACANLEESTCAAPPLTTLVASPAQGELAMRGQVRALLSLLYPAGNVVERRRDARYPFPFLVTLLPLGPHGLAPVGPEVVVAGKQLSERGLGFYHPAPLPYRRVLATVNAETGARLRCVMDVSWCRFTRVGWYESGGRFLEVLPSESDNWT